MKRAFSFAIVTVVTSLAVSACGPRGKLPEGPAPEYEPGRTWTDGGTPVPATSSSAAPRT